MDEDQSRGDGQDPDAHALLGKARSNVIPVKQFRRACSDIGLGFMKRPDGKSLNYPHKSSKEGLRKNPHHYGKALPPSLQLRGNVKLPLPLIN